MRDSWSSTSISTICTPCGRISSITPLTTRPKNGSVKIRPTNGVATRPCSASETTRAMESVLLVTSERAARLGT